MDLDGYLEVLEILKHPDVMHLDEHKVQLLLDYLDRHRIEQAWALGSEKQRRMANLFWDWNTETSKTVLAAVGGNRSLSPDMPIDRPDGDSRPVSEIRGRHMVWAWDERTKRKVPAWAGEPFIKSRSDLYRYHFDDGTFLECTPEHRVLSSCGWIGIGELPKFAGGLPGTTSDIDLSTPWLDGLRCFGTTPNSLSGCPVCFCSCGGRLLSEEGGDPSDVPSLNDVRAHSSRETVCQDACSSKSERTRPCPLCGHPSSRDAQGRTLAHDAGTGFRSSGTASPPSETHSLAARISSRASCQQRSIAVSCRSAIGVAHPSIVTPSGRPLRILYAEHLGAGPIWDLSVPGYETYLTGSTGEAGGVVSHNSGKSYVAGHMCVARYLRDMAKPGELIWCISPTYARSIDGPQKELWKALPHDRFSREFSPEHGYGQYGIVQYKCGGGQGKATIEFKQECQELQTFEGAKVKLVWWDEASKEQLFGRLLARIADSGGKIFISTIPNELWLKFRIQESGNPRWEFQQFVTYDNAHTMPAGAVDELIAGLSPEERKMRIDGEFVSLSGVIIPEFICTMEPAGHLTKSFRLPKGWPSWVYIDPGFYTAAMLLTVNPDEKMIVVDEVYTEGQKVADNIEDIRHMLERHGIKECDPSGGFYIDPSSFNYSAGNEVTVGDQYEEGGIPVQRWVRTKDVGEKALINKMRVAFGENRILMTDKCINLARELRVWRWKMDDVQKVDIREVQDVGPNHAIDCVKGFIASDPTYHQPELLVVDTPQYF